MSKNIRAIRKQKDVLWKKVEELDREIETLEGLPFPDERILKLKQQRMSLEQHIGDLDVRWKT